MLQEQDMREFFERIIGDFTGLNAKAQEVDNLNQRVNDLMVRVASLEAENTQLRQDIDEAWNHSRELEARNEDLRTQLAEAQGAVKSLQDTIVYRDNKVTELQRETQEAEDRHNQAVDERNAAQNRANDLQALVDQLRLELEDMTTDRNRWKEDAQTNGNLVVEMRATLARVQGILNPPRPVDFGSSEFKPSAQVG